MKIKGYTRSDGVKVKGHSRVGTKAKARKYSAAQRRALDKSRTSKSGHKSWRERQSDAKKNGGSAGLWANVWRKRKRARDKRKRR